jgi:hypothetical protein
MTPRDLIDWAVAIGICTIVFRWIAGIFGSKCSRKKFEERMASIENRLEKLEKKP